MDDRPRVMCCLCGAVIPANPANMCANCIRTQVDITEEFPKQLPLPWCHGCGRILANQVWVKCEAESKELLAILIKKVRGLREKANLIDAKFIWTEPHSKRIKIHLTIQKEVFTGTVIQQSFIVEFALQNQYCEACHKAQSANTWAACVQLRQRVGHKRSIYFIEQMVLKHNVQKNVTGIKEMPDGLDFFFLSERHAMNFADFIANNVPTRLKSSKQLISKDDHNNTSVFKTTFMQEVVPVCREDLVCLPPNVSRGLNNIGPIVIIQKISSNIHVLDPQTLKHGEITPNGYWTNPFRSLFPSTALTEFVVLDVTPVGVATKKHELVEVQIAKAADLGVRDITYFTKSHLGKVLNCGDVVLGYLIVGANFNDDNAEKYSMRKELPDVILVRKGYKQRRGKRFWELQRLPKEDDDIKSKRNIMQEEKDFEGLMEELERDPELRKEVNLYRTKDAEQVIDAEKAQREDIDMDGEELPENPDDVDVNELLGPLKDLEIKDTSEKMSVLDV